MEHGRRNIITGGSMTFAPVVMIGAACFLASVALMVKGAAARKALLGD